MDNRTLKEILDSKKLRLYVSVEDNVAHCHTMLLDAEDNPKHTAEEISDAVDLLDAENTAVRERRAAILLIRQAVLKSQGSSVFYVFQPTKGSTTVSSYFQREPDVKFPHVDKTTGRALWIPLHSGKNHPSCLSATGAKVAVSVAVELFWLNDKNDYERKSDITDFSEIYESIFQSRSISSDEVDELSCLYFDVIEKLMKRTSPTRNYYLSDHFYRDMCFSAVSAGSQIRLSNFSLARFRDSDSSEPSEYRNRIVEIIETGEVKVQRMVTIQSYVKLMDVVEEVHRFKSCRNFEIKCANFGPHYEKKVMKKLERARDALPEELKDEIPTNPYPPNIQVFDDFASYQIDPCRGFLVGDDFPNSSRHTDKPTISSHQNTYDFFWGHPHTLSLRRRGSGALDLDNIRMIMKTLGWSDKTQQEALEKIAEITEEG